MTDLSALIARVEEGTDKAVLAAAEAEARYDGYDGLVSLSKIARERYVDRARAAITAFQAEAWQPRVTMPRDATISVVVAATDKNRTFAGRRDVLSVYIDSEGQFENDPENEFWAITHWQPLPNPPASP